MKTIDVKVDGTDEYALKGLSIKLTKMKDLFKGNDEFKIFDGNDKLIGSSKSDKLSGYAGKDTINGGNGGDSIWGTDGNDLLYGEAGADVISGGKDNDLLDGGLGLNTLTGNQGNDTFHFSAQFGVGTSSAITVFKSGEDSFELVKSVFPDLTGSGELAASKFIKSTDYAGEDGVVVYDKAKGGISYAVDSNSLIKFAEVSANLNLKASDFYLV